MNNAPSAPALSPVPKQEKRLLYVLASIMFAHIVDFMVMMPQGPMLQRHLGISADQFGVLVSSYTFAAALSGLVCALLLDQFDRKRSLMVLTTLFSLSTLACALAWDYGSLLVARAMAGAFGGVLGAVVNTVVGDHVPPERRGRAGGILSSAFALSTVAGVPLSLLVSSHAGDLNLSWLHPNEGWRLPFVLIAILGFWAVYWVGRVLPSKSFSTGAAPAAAQSGLQGLSLMVRRLVQTASDKQHLWAIAFGCSVLFSSFSVIPYLTLYGIGTLHFPEKMLSLMYLVGGAATLISARRIGRYSDRVGKRKSYTRFAVLALLPILLITHAHLAFETIPPWLYIAISTSFFVLVSGRWIPAMALMTGAAKPELRGTFMSLQASAQQAAMGLATLVTGHIVYTDAQGLLHHFHIAGYVAVLATLLAFFLVRKVQHRG
jgi:predicted MFS family arabinose efflux permease